jgi:hypothetical protein
MWILPRQLHTSAFVPDTEALISDSDEFSQLCAQSLTARGKDSAARIWSAKLKRDSWMQLLFGRTLRPSHGSSFVDAWTSSLAATRASHSAPPASDSVPKTQDTSGRLSQPELLQCDQVPVSLRTSRDISALGFPTCCKTWQEWVTERRGAWRQRVNAVRLTRGRGSSSWPTMHMGSNERGAYYDKTGKGQRYLSDAVVDEQKNWPTVRASEYKDVGPVGSKSHDHMLGKHYLCAVVTQDAANWPTPNANEIQNPNKEYRSPCNAYRGDKKVQPMLCDAVHHYGQAAPASSSSLGSRQGLWATPTNCDHKGATTPEACKQWESRGQNLPEMVNGMWPTPASCTGNGGSHGLDGGSGARSMLPEDMKRSSGKLNPRWVETLMGLPIGWTMPSCTSPQTIAPMSCDSSAMELCRPPQSGLFEFSLAS